MFQRQVQLYGMGYGAGNVSYLPDTTFPLFNYFGRGGILPTFHWGILQSEQFWVNPVQRVIGNPGISIGNLRPQGMIDTRGINNTVPGGVNGV